MSLENLIPAYKTEIFWQQFDRNIMPEPNSGCHIWIGSRLSRGHGNLRVNGGHKLAHHVAWFRAYGHWPKQLNHNCGLPCCVNEVHLYEGGQSENIRDLWRHGSRPGPKLRISLMQREQIKAAVASGWKKTELAEWYGCSVSAIHHILRKAK